MRKHRECVDEYGDMSCFVSARDELAIRFLY